MHLSRLLMPSLMPIRMCSFQQALQKVWEQDMLVASLARTSLRHTMQAISPLPVVGQSSGRRGDGGALHGGCPQICTMPSHSPASQPAAQSPCRPAPAPRHTRCAALRCPAGQAWAHKGAPVWLVHARQARVPPVLPHAHQRAAPAPRSLRGCPPACTRPPPPAPQWCLRTARGPGGAGQQVEKVVFPLHGQQYGP